jgi:dimeric dUTPase (all-alpha-NTP-PPase superfamily)
MDSDLETNLRKFAISRQASFAWRVRVSAFLGKTQKHSQSVAWRNGKPCQKAIIRRDVVDLLHDIKFNLLFFHS